MTLPGELRSWMQETLVESVDKPGLLVLVAPTGSGKSRAAIHHPELLERAGRIIHVLPLRTLVEELVVDLACVLEDKLAYQAGVEKIAYRRLGDRCRLTRGGAADGRVVKDPYMLHPYTVTTYDSYSLALVLAPVPEVSYAEYGHQDMGFAALATATTFFDEAHLLAPDSGPEAGSDDDVKALALLATASRMLHVVGSKPIIATATLHPVIPSLIAGAARIPVRAVVLQAGWLVEEYRRVFGLEAVEGKAVEREASTTVEGYIASLETRVAAREPWEEAAHRCREAERVLVVLNTVARAVRAYTELKRACGEARVVLLHGRLARNHRASNTAVVVEALENGERLVVVATQVVEAGVDIDADVLVSDAAPIDSLIQRAGRVLRHSLDERKAAVVVAATTDALRSCSRVYGIDCGRLAAKLKAMVEKCGGKVDWRYGWPRACTAYRLLLGSEPRIDRSKLDVHVNSIWGIVARTYRVNLAVLVKTVDQVFRGSLVRDAVRIPLIVRTADGWDVVEAPTWKALELASKGLLEPKVRLSLVVHNEDGTVERTNVDVRVSRVDGLVRSLSSTPITTLRQLYQDVSKRLHTARPHSLVFEGVVAAGGAYDHELGLL